MDAAIIAGRYEIRRTLGRGATGEVFEVWRDDLQRAFALKLLSGGSSALGERFLREAQLLGRLRHPHIVDVVDFGHDPEHAHAAFVVTELLHGRTLAQAQQQGVASEDALVWIEQLAAAVDHAHAQGVLHRDLKPENVMLVPAGDGHEAVKVLDFGLGRLAACADRTPASEPPDRVTAEPRLTDAVALLGTPLYVAPEAIDGPQGEAAADIYSLGVIAYELLVGSPPFSGSVAEVLCGHRQAEPPDPKAAGVVLPAEAWAALRAALSKQPAARPTSASALAMALRNGFELDRERSRSRRRRRRTPVALFAAVVATVALSAGLAAWPRAALLDERAADLLLGTLPQRPPAPELLMVAIDDHALENDPRPLSERGDDVADGLGLILAAGARAVGLDLLPPESWSRSPRFAALLLAHHERLTLSLLAAPEHAPVGLEALPSAVREGLPPEALIALFGYVNLPASADGAVRHAWPAVRDGAGRAWPSFVGRLVGATGATSTRLDGRVDPASLLKLSWSELRTAAAREPSPFRGRLVLVGASFTGSGDDGHRVVVSGALRPVAGLLVQALAADALLQPQPLRSVSPAAWAMALGTIAAVGLTLLPRTRTRWAIGGLGLAMALLGPLVAVRWGAVLPLATGLLSLAPGVLVGLLARNWIEG